MFITAVPALLSAIPCLADTGSFTLDISGDTSVKPGDTAAYTFTLRDVTESSGILGGDVYINYDSSVLAFTGVQLLERW